MGPNKADAAIVMDRLMQQVFALRKELAKRDPEGRSLNLGITMFFGAHMAVVPYEYRQEMCDAAIGYSLQANDFLDRLSKDEKGAPDMA